MVSLSIEGLSVTLGGSPVVRDVSARLEGGALVGIIGPNGAGKSTLVRAMAGLVTPAQGQVWLDGHAVSGMAHDALARRMAYLPQGQMLHWPLSVERLVALGRMPHLAPYSRLSPADAQAVDEAMRRADCLHLRKRDATTLSGGERARAMLARALATGGDVLVVDEPLAALDPGHQIDVMALLSAETQRGVLVVAVLHDLAMAARWCDRLLVLDEGQLVADGAPAQVLTPERLEQTYGIKAYFGGDPACPMIVPVGRAR